MYVRTAVKPEVLFCMTMVVASNGSSLSSVFYILHAPLQSVDYYIIPWYRLVVASNQDVFGTTIPYTTLARNISGIWFCDQTLNVDYILGQSTWHSGLEYKQRFIFLSELIGGYIPGQSTWYLVSYLTISSKIKVFINNNPLRTLQSRFGDKPLQF